MRMKTKNKNKGKNLYNQLEKLSSNHELNISPISIGYHTFSVQNIISEFDALTLISHFKNFRDRTGEITIISSQKYYKSWDIVYNNKVGI